MTPTLAKKLLVQLDFKTVEVLKEYVDERIDSLRTITEQSPELSRILHAQGSISELKRLLDVRQHAEAVLKPDLEG